MRVTRVLIVAAAAVAAIAPIPPAWIERWYSRALYPRLQPAVTYVSSLVPFALLDVAAGVLLVAGAVALARRWRASGPRHALSALFAWLLVTASVVYLWFLVFWGFNYRRIPLEQKLAYDASRVARGRALDVARVAVEQANALAAEAGRSPGDDRALAQALAEVEQLLGSRAAARPAAPKRSLLTWYFRQAAIDGMTDPFFLEVIVHPELLPFERPITLAHEWAHLAGYADESEASFVAWLTCVRATPAARYSGWLAAYQQLAAVLPREDRAALRAALSPAVAADLAAARERLAKASPRVTTAARAAYDTYLRANRIEEGIFNYDLVVRLMLGTQFEQEWRPQLRPR